MFFCRILNRSASCYASQLNFIQMDASVGESLLQMSLENAAKPYITLKNNIRNNLNSSTVTTIPEMYSILAGSRPSKLEIENISSILDILFPLEVIESQWCWRHLQLWRLRGIKQFRVEWKGPTSSKKLDGPRNMASGTEEGPCITSIYRSFTLKILKKLGLKWSVLFIKLL